MGVNDVAHGTEEGSVTSKFNFFSAIALCSSDSLLRATRIVVKSTPASVAAAIAFDRSAT